MLLKILVFLTSPTFQLMNPDKGDMWRQNSTCFELSWTEPLLARARSSQCVSGSNASKKSARKWIRKRFKMLKMWYIKVKLTPKLLTLALRKPQLIMRKGYVSFLRLKPPFSSKLQATILTSFMMIWIKKFDFRLFRNEPETSNEAEGNATSACTTSTCSHLTRTSKLRNTSFMLLLP